MIDLTDIKNYDNLLKQLNNDLFDDIEEFIDYVLNESNLQVGDIEILLRNILEDAIEIIKKYIQKKFKIKESDLRNFPPLDDLIYHDEGWTLHNAIDKHLQAYNRQRIKQNLINALMSILVTEIQRLPNTVFDEIVQRAELFECVTIFGNADCGETCSKHFGTYLIGIDKYTLPPYHKAYWNGKRFVPGCKCKRVYHNVDELDEDTIEELEEMLDDDFT